MKKNSLLVAIGSLILCSTQLTLFQRFKNVGEDKKESYVIKERNPTNY